MSSISGKVNPSIGSKSRHCKHCKEKFYKVGIMWEHRIPSAGPVSPPRCLSREEMFAKGWVQVNARWAPAGIKPGIKGSMWRNLDGGGKYRLQA